jgi:hypothetical protein
MASVYREITAVDDVRRVRERLEREFGGDMRRHIANTNAAFEQLRSRLGLKLVPVQATPPSSKASHG